MTTTSEPHYVRLEVPRCEVDGESVLFNPLDGSYLALNAVSSRIWDLLEQQPTLAAICENLLQHYEIDRSTCEQQTSDFLRELAQAGLVNTRKDDAATGV